MPLSGQTEVDIKSYHRISTLPVTWTPDKTNFKGPKGALESNSRLQLLGCGPRSGEKKVCCKPVAGISQRLELPFLLSTSTLQKIVSGQSSLLHLPSSPILASFNPNPKSVFPHLSLHLLLCLPSFRIAY